MENLDQILLTSAFTIVGGIIVFVIGQVLIAPYIEYRRVIGEIDEELTFSSDIFMNPGPHNAGTDIALNAHANLRRIASKWAAVYNKVSIRKILVFLKIIVTEESKNKIKSNLIGISNSLWTQDCIEHNEKRNGEIRNLLHI